MKAAHDLTGRVFGNLRVIERTPKPDGMKGTAAFWRVACVCGSALFTVRSDSLLQGRTTRCVTCAHNGKTAPEKKQGDTKPSATRSERELEKSLARAQQYGAWRRELTPSGPLPGEPRAAFSAQDHHEHRYPAATRPAAITLQCGPDVAPLSAGGPSAA